MRYFYHFKCVDKSEVCMNERNTLMMVINIKLPALSEQTVEILITGNETKSSNSRNKCLDLIILYKRKTRVILLITITKY